MLIEGATVVTVDPADRVLDRGWVSIRDGVIEAVSDAPIDAAPGEKRIDGSGKVVIPGLVNAHTHLFQTLIRGVYEDLPFREWLRAIYHCGVVLRDEDFAMAARVGALEALLGGTTTVVEHHFLNGPGDAPAATIGAMREAGLRTVFARTAMDMADLAPEALLETPAAAAVAADRVVATHDQADGLTSVFVGPNTPGVSAGPDMARAMTELATSRGIRQSMHIAEARSSRDTVRERYGVDGVIRWLDSIGALQGPILAPHSVHIDAGEMAMMAERGVAIAHNPICNLFLGDGIAPITEARQAGVTVALGTDGAASNNSQDMFQVLKLSGLLQRGRLEDPLAVTAAGALRMATIDGARALGLDHVVGSIEPGKRADLVVLDLLASPRNVAMHDVVSQVVHCAQSADVETVMVDGEIIIDRRRHVRINQGELVRRAQEQGRDLVRRLHA